MSSWPPAGYDRQRELFDDTDSGPIEQTRDVCDHRAGDWSVSTSTTSGAELVAECRRCGAKLHRFVDVDEMDAVERRSGR